MIILTSMLAEGRLDSFRVKRFIVTDLYTVEIL
jgi:hypothetical protein